MNSLESHQHAVRESFRSKTDKVLEFAKAQDNKIKELTEQNKKLKNDLRLCAEGLIPNDLIQRGIVETCREKVKQLEEENKKLQEHYDNSIHTDWIAEAAGEDPEYYRDVCCADTLGKMIKENKKLKKENKERITQIQCMELEQKEMLEAGWTYKKLITHIQCMELEYEREGSNLWEQYNKYKQIVDTQKAHDRKFEIKNKKLKDENKKLRDVNKKLYETLNKENEQLKEEIKHKNEKFSEWCEQNKELREENKKLQEEKEDTLASLNFYQECNEELKEEIKKLKEEIKKLYDNSIQYCES